MPADQTEGAPRAGGAQATVYDLFCGAGGWTAGFVEAGARVVGFDVDRHPDYHGELVLQDVRTLDGRRLRGAACIVASPPCQGFSLVNPARHRGERPNADDLSCVEATASIIKEAEPRAWVVENVRGALPFFEPILGRPRLRYGAFYLWGRWPPFLVERANARPKYGGPVWRTGGRRVRGRPPDVTARIPIELARPLAAAVLR